MQNNKSSGIMKYIYPILSIGLFLVIWQCGVSFTDLSKVLSGPIPVIVKFFRSIFEPIGTHTIQMHIIWSLKRVLPAYIVGSVLGITLGILMGWYPFIKAIFSPIYNFVRPVPFFFTCCLPS